MHCPQCSADDTKILFSRKLSTHVCRGHHCQSCDWKFETHEVYVTVAQPRAVQPYDPVGLPVQNTAAHSPATQPLPAQPEEDLAGVLEAKLQLLLNQPPET